MAPKASMNFNRGDSTTPLQAPLSGQEPSPVFVPSARLHKRRNAVILTRESFLRTYVPRHDPTSDPDRLRAGGEESKANHERKEEEEGENDYSHAQAFRSACPPVSKSQARVRRNAICTELLFPGYEQKYNLSFQQTTHAIHATSKKEEKEDSSHTTPHCGTQQPTLKGPEPTTTWEANKEHGKRNGPTNKWFFQRRRNAMSLDSKAYKVLWKNPTHDHGQDPTYLTAAFQPYPKSTQSPTPMPSTHTDSENETGFTGNDEARLFMGEPAMEHDPEDDEQGDSITNTGPSAAKKGYHSLCDSDEGVFDATRIDLSRATHHTCSDLETADAEGEAADNSASSHSHSHSHSHPHPLTPPPRLFLGYHFAEDATCDHGTQSNCGGLSARATGGIDFSSAPPSPTASSVSMSYMSDVAEPSVGMKRSGDDLLCDSRFTPWLYSEEQLMDIVYRGFCRFNLIQKFGIPKETLFRFVEALKSTQDTSSVLSADVQQYNPFHNFYRSVDMFQMIVAFLIHGGAEHMLSSTQIFSLLLSSLSVFLGHPGTTNAIEVATQSDLAITYNDKDVLQNMHAACLFRILKQPDRNILQAVSAECFAEIRSYVIHNIMSMSAIPEEGTDKEKEDIVSAFCSLKDVVRSNMCLSGGVMVREDETYQPRDDGADGEKEGEDDWKENESRAYSLALNLSLDPTDAKCVMSFLLYAASVSYVARPIYIAKYWYDLRNREHSALVDYCKRVGLDDETSPLLAGLNPPPSFATLVDSTVLPVMNLLSRVFFGGRDLSAMALHNKAYLSKLHSEP